MELIKLIISYFSLYTILIFFGRSFYLIYSKLSKNKSFKIFGLDPFYFYSLTGVFLVSNIIFILNFFVPSKSIYVYLSLGILLSFNFFAEFKFNFSKDKFFFLLTFPLVFSVYNNSGSSDAFMYHFSHQRIILQEKIILGLTNLTPAYGYSSIFEYISSLLWVDNIYLFIQLINLVFIGSFFHLLYYFFTTKNFQLKNISLLVLIIGVLDNFGFEGGRNGFIFIQEVGKFDASFGIIFFLCFIFILLFTDEDKPNKLDTYFVFLCVTFLAQIKPFGYILFIPLIIVSIYKFKNKILHLILKNYVFLFLNVFWVVKNIMLSSCIVFPAQFTCLRNLKWHFPYQAKLSSLEAMANNRNPNVGLESLNGYRWIVEYWIEQNSSYILNFIFSLFILFGLFYNNKKLFTKKTDYLLFFTVISFILLWLNYFPNYRFVIGYLLSLYLVLLYRKMSKPLNSKFQLLYNKKLFLIIFLVSFALTIRLDSYKSVILNIDSNLD